MESKRNRGPISISRLFETQEIVLLIGLFIVAFSIRAIGLKWGLPSQNEPYAAYMADERGVLEASIALGNRQYSYVLQFFPFFYYLSFLVLGLYYGIGLVAGRFSGWEDFLAQYVQDISQFLIVGRLFSIIVASLTVLATYYVGKRMFGKRTGLFGAVFLLFSFGHIVYSQVFRLDTFLPLAFMVTFYLILNLINNDDGRLRPYIFTGLALGITAATKVTGWSLLVPYLMVGFVEHERFSLKPLRSLRFDRRFVFGSFIALATFVALAAPGLINIERVVRTVINPIIGPSTITGSGVSDDSEVIRSFVNASILSPYKHSIVWHVTQILPRSVGLTIYPIAILGLIFMIFDKTKRVYSMLFLATMIVYLIPVGYSVRTTWRDMLPVLPFFAISAGYLVQDVVTGIMNRTNRIQKLYYRTSFPVVVLILLLAHPLYSIYRQKILLLQPDTRDLAKTWIESNLPPGSKIAMEDYGPGILDLPTEEFRKDFAGKYGSENTATRNLQVPMYRVYQLVNDLSEGKDALQPDHLLAYLRDNEIEYVVVSSAYYGRFYNEAIDIHSPVRAKKGRAFHDVVESNLELVAQFIPNWEVRPGPVIKVYEVPRSMNDEDVVELGSFAPFPGMDRPASAVGYFQFSPR